MTLLRHRYFPTAVAAGFALVYVIVSPPSLDLAAHLFRAKLFNEEGFGLWDNSVVRRPRHGRVQRPVPGRSRRR